MTSPSRVALVTGASQGIGRVVACELAALGFRVAAAARSLEHLQELEAQTGAVAVPLDVTDRRAVADAIDPCRVGARADRPSGQQRGSLGPGGMSWEIDDEEWWKVVEVNVKGTSSAAVPSAVHGCPRRRANRQRLVERTFFRLEDDFAGVIGSAYMAGSRRRSVVTETLAAEARPSGVHVFAISPGTVKTDMTASIFAGNWDDPDFWSPPELAAELVSFIASGALTPSQAGTFTQRRTTGGRSRTTATEILARDLHALRLRSE